MQETVRDQDEMEWLKLDYQMCHAGYNSRDQITEDEFSKLVQVFSIFLTVIVAVNVFVKVNTFLHIVLCIVIGVSGFLSMVSFLIDLESASSCKIALRKRCKEIEALISNGNIMQYWLSIESREKYGEEKFLKNLLSKLKSSGIVRSDIERDLYINAARALIILWLFIVISMVVWGSSIELSPK